MSSVNGAWMMKGRGVKREGVVSIWIGFGQRAMRGLFYRREVVACRCVCLWGRW